ncbi:zinc knuckle CX2CX4HX4C containing protein [Tanacetum coccineum]
MEQRGVININKDLLNTVAARRNKMTGKGSIDSQMAGRVNENPNATNVENPKGTQGVPLNTLGDINNLTKVIDLGKLEVWSTLPSEKHSGKIDVGIGKIKRGTYEVRSKLTREQRKAILKNAHNGWNNLVKLQKKATMVDKQSGEVSLDDPIIKIVNVNEKPSSYISAAGGSILDPIKPKANFCSLSSDNLFKGANVSIPRNIIEMVSSRLANTLYGYFIGKRIAFPVVEYFVRNNWGKYGLTRIMMNSKGFFFFQFKTLKGLEDMLENGPWMIQDGLSIIASKLDSLNIGIPCEDDGFSIETVSIEYEWKPPCCDLCKIFSYSHDCFPKKVLIPNAETSNVITPSVVNTSIVPTPLVEKTNDGFQTVGKKKKKCKSKSNAVNMVNSPNQDNITSSNSFAAVNEDFEEEEEVENVFDETANLFNSKTGGISSFTAAFG